MSKKAVYFLSIFSLLILSISMVGSHHWKKTVLASSLKVAETSKYPQGAKYLKVKQEITIADYFPFMDSLVSQYDSLVSYPLSEHLLVHFNPWIIDTLANTDYYRMIERDSFVYDQRKMVVLRATDSLLLPDQDQAVKGIQRLASTWLAINIPEFRLRIYRDSTLLYSFPIRVGQAKEKYLAMCDRITDLRTIPGHGRIIRHQRDPDFYDPVSCKRFYTTKRDDGKVTLMPQIPWIETEINGVRNGQMIHPTTNPMSLNKAYSNGCIGTREADAWYIYYNAPLDTKINIEYRLKVKDSLGQELLLKDIYKWGLRPD